MSVIADHIAVGTSATQLPDVPCRRVHLAPRGEASIWVGDSDVTPGVNGNGFPLNNYIILEEISNLNEVYVVASVETAIRYLVER